jgi:hypothetical protein
LDEPTFPAGKYDIPSGFWEQSAEQVFKAAKDIVDVIEICRDKLPMSALVLFTIWTAAFVGQYAWHFPHMDQQRHMLLADDDENGDGSEEMDMTKVGPTGVCYQTLVRFSGWLKMASTYLGYLWVKHFAGDTKESSPGYDTFWIAAAYANSYVPNSKDLDNYMAKIRYEYRALSQANSKSGSAPQDDGKHPIHGGGLAEWKVQNAKIINNGMIMAEDDRHEPYGSSDRSRVSPPERQSPTGHDVHLAEKMPGPTPTMFTAINNTPAVGRHELPTSDSLANLDGQPESDDTGAGPMLQGEQPLPAADHTLPGPHDLDFMSETQFRDLIMESESMRIAEALEGLGGGDIQGFSYGDIPEAILFGNILPGPTFGTSSNWQLAEEAETEQTAKADSPHNQSMPAWDGVYSGLVQGNSFLFCWGGGGCNNAERPVSNKWKKTKSRL